MRRKLAALTGGLALAFAFAIPAAANAAPVRASGPAIARPADANQGCGELFDAGNGGVGNLNDQNNLIFPNPAEPEIEFCNVSISINGEFEISLGGVGGECMAVNSSTTYIDVDSAAACSSRSGDGDKWDRWTATEESVTSGVTYWEFQNESNGKCIYDDEQVPTIYTTCSNPDEFEWFAWPGSNL
jgi:hypothetical protein